MDLERVADEIAALDRSKYSESGWRERILMLLQEYDYPDRNDPVELIIKYLNDQARMLLSSGLDSQASVLFMAAAAIRAGRYVVEIS